MSDENTPLALGRFPDRDNPKHKDDPEGPFDDNHFQHFGTALQRALDCIPLGEHDDVPIHFIADIRRTNPGGIKEYKVQIGG